MGNGALGIGQWSKTLTIIHHPLPITHHSLPMPHAPCAITDYPLPEIETNPTVLLFFLLVMALGHNRQDGRDDSAICAVSPASYRAMGQTFLWLG